MSVGCIKAFCKLERVAVAVALQRKLGALSAVVVVVHGHLMT